MDERRIGELFLVGFNGTGMDAELVEFLDELNPAGVVLFKRNVENPVQVAALNRELQLNAARRGSNGMLIGVDQEGGRVARLGEPFAVLPPALDLASSDPTGESVRRAFDLVAKELSLVGFSLDFVPVLDVLTPEADTSLGVIGDRAFGYDPDLVGRMGAIVIEVMASKGIIACCKHFPGHGGVTVDSHVDLPVDPRKRTEIEARDLRPFRDAVDGGVEMVMTAHVLYPSLDRNSPATLSPIIIGDLLRRYLGFDGVVVTDDMDMAAIAARHSPEESALAALRAGADLLLICNRPQEAVSARDAVLQAVRSREITQARIEDSLRRIRNLKTRYASSMRPCDTRAAAYHFREKTRNGLT